MNKQPVLYCFHSSGKLLKSNNYSVRNYVGKNWAELLHEHLVDQAATYVVALSYPQRDGTVELWIYTLHDYSLLERNKLPKQHQVEISTFTPQLNFSQYEQRFNKVQELIALGDVYQLNLTFPFTAKTICSAEELFLFYQQQFHGDYFALLPNGQDAIVSFSPELFLERRDMELLTRPIKGTAALGDRDRLLASSKEQAELSMIVDLLRNDLNLVADISAAEVVKHRDILEIGHILHTYSEIRCQSSWPLALILEKVFPGGSITGCPKLAAMHYISELEIAARSFYCGSIGVIEGGHATFNINIRSFYYQAGLVRYFAGGGIVVESSAEQEYAEILLKAQQIRGLDK